MLEALENWLRRCDTPAVRSFVRAMVQGDRLGVSIGQILRNQAVEMRARQKEIIEERAQKAPIKILFPLVFLIFPAMFVVILGPALLNIPHHLTSLTALVCAPVALLVGLVERALDEALLVGVAGGLGAVRDVQLAVDVRQVELDGLRGDPELLGDRGVRLALRERGQDRELACGEARLPWRRSRRSRRRARSPCRRSRRSPAGSRRAGRSG